MNPVIGCHFRSIQLTSLIIIYHYPQREEFIVFIRSIDSILIDFQHWKFILNKWVHYPSRLEKQAIKLIQQKQTYFIHTHPSQQGKFEKDWSDLIGYCNGYCSLNPLWIENDELRFENHRVPKFQLLPPIPDNELHPNYQPLGGILMRSLINCVGEHSQKFEHEFTNGECFCLGKGKVYRGCERREGRNVLTIHHMCPVCFHLVKRLKKHLKQVHSLNRWPTLLDVEPPLMVRPIPMDLFLSFSIDKKQLDLVDLPEQHLSPNHVLEIQHLQLETKLTNKPEGELNEEIELKNENSLVG
jgi:hypothetical protein